MERGGRCICKYNVEGDRCDQCKRGHFYLNSLTPNGCLPCFCSGVSTDCTSTDWRREAVDLIVSLTFEVHNLFFFFFLISLLFH